ncbi:MAG: damage-inducible protein DinB [Rhizobiaceae bacterium]|nr:damage-inducible protein DinB [Rhizobiaceae bacterium]
MIDHFIMFATYNRWANQRLYDAAQKLTNEQYLADCEVAFSSMQGTLNHILVGDTAWMSRFQQVPNPIKSLEAVLYADFDDLWTARQQMDARIIDYVDGLDETILSSDFSYTPVLNPEKITQKLAPTLAHLFNHQTHHRGQAHAILTRLTGEAPPLDLIYYMLETQTQKVS